MNHSQKNLTDPVEQRRFAIEVVTKLRERGYESLLAGGCVRDQLMGNVPTDYDVATNAIPEQIREVFGRARTLAIGAAFGVIAVIGKKSEGVVEVATFRQDIGYSDGRRPDAVEFCTAQKDAERRDFTINGMFFDPLANRVLDYVGGQADLKNKRIRAIGDPRARFTEDKLRLLRAVRFTTRFDFELEAETLAAICELAPNVKTVSAERIAEEMRKLLGQAGASQGIALLRTSRLLAHVLPEWDFEKNSNANEAEWTQMLAELDGVEKRDFRLGIAVVLGLIASKNVPARAVAREIGRRWKLSNDEIETIEWLIANQGSLVGATERSWSSVQPLLVHPSATLLLEWTKARDRVLERTVDDVEFCQKKLSLPGGQLNPPPLLTGDDLVRNGWKPGREFARVISAVRAAQLDNLIHSFDDAMALANQIRDDHSA